MPKYTIEDTQTQKRITFQWDDPNPPTDSDFEQVLEQARREQPDKFTALAETAASEVAPSPTEVPGGSFIQKLASATGESLTPPMTTDAATRMIRPAVGQFGLSRLLQEGGEKVQDAVSSVSPTAGAILPPLTPRAQAENLGAEGLQVAAPIARAAGRGGARFAQLMSGLKAEDLARVAENPKILLPESMGGPIARKEAGKVMGEVEKAAGMTKEVAQEGTGGMGKFKGQTSPFKGDQGIADIYFEKVSKGEGLTPPELLEAHRSTSRTLSKMSRKDARYVQMVEFDKALKKTLGEISPEWTKAADEYAKSATRAKVTNFLPRTETGKVSPGRLGFNALILGSGFLSAKLPVLMAASAPITYGLTAAGAGVAAKTAAVPGVKALGLSAILARNRQQKKK